MLPSTPCGAQATALIGVHEACGDVAFQGAIEFPDPAAGALDQAVLRRRGAAELLDLPLGMDPTAGMVTDGELRGAVADHDDAVQKTLLEDGAP